MTYSNDQTVVLAGDIGGTKTNLGLYVKGKQRPLLKTMETYSSSESSNIEDIIEQFVLRHGASVAVACFGIAGPVRDGRSKTTNLPWKVSAARIKKRFKWDRVCLINDLAATALAIPVLGGREIYSMNTERAGRGRHIGLVAPGTGLGMALLISSGNRYIPVPSEGGHMDFGPNNEAEVRLWEYLHRRFGHVSMERVLSGPGLFNIYSWLRDSGRYKEPAWLAGKIKKADPPRAITEAAVDRKSPLSVAALNMFASIFGAVAGNLALAAMTTGGMYLGGGIPPKILPRLQEQTFMKSFVNKGRFKAFLEKIPVRVILNDKAALLGAARCAFEKSD